MSDAEKVPPPKQEIRKIPPRRNGKFIKQSHLDKIKRSQEMVAKRFAERRLLKELGPQCPIQGRRLVDLKVMAHALVCSCGEILSLIDVQREYRAGMASIFHVKCRKCLLINMVPTSKIFNRHYDVNTDAVYGYVNNGIDLQTMRKFLTLMDIPGKESKTLTFDKNFIGPETKQASDRKKRLEELKEEKALKEKNKKRRRKRGPKKTDEEPNSKIQNLSQTSSANEGVANASCSNLVNEEIVGQNLNSSAQKVVVQSIHSTPANELSELNDSNVVSEELVEMISFNNSENEELAAPSENNLANDELVEVINYNNAENEELAVSNESSLTDLELVEPNYKTLQMKGTEEMLTPRPKRVIVPKKPEIRRSNRPRIPRTPSILDTDYNNLVTKKIGSARSKLKVKPTKVKKARRPYTFRTAPLEVPNFSDLVKEEPSFQNSSPESIDDSSVSDQKVHDFSSVFMPEYSDVSVSNEFAIKQEIDDSSGETPDTPFVHHKKIILQQITEKEILGP